MNKQMKLQLESVVNAIVNEDTDAAKEAFHDYLRAKTQSILLGEADDADDAEDDKSDDKEDKKDDDKSDKKAPPFAKKDKKDADKKDDKEDKKDE